jgi:hypothetical protein
VALEKKRNAGVLVICILTWVISGLAVFSVVRSLFLGGPAANVFISYKLINLAANLALILAALFFFWLKKASLPLSVLGLILTIFGTVALVGKLWLMAILSPIFIGLNISTFALVIYSAVLFKRGELS